MFELCTFTRHLTNNSTTIQACYFIHEHSRLTALATICAHMFASDLVPQKANHLLGKDSAYETSFSHVRIHGF